MKQELDTLNLIKHYINISNTALSESDKKQPPTVRKNSFR
jgi:hypothetical protein